MVTKSTTSPIPAASIEKLISEAEGRFGEAVASSSRMVEHAAAFAKGNVDAAFASTRIAISGIDALAKDVGQLPMKKWETVWTTMPAAASPTDLLRAQAEQMSATLEQMVATGSRLGEAMFKLGFEVAQPLTSRCAEAMADMPQWLEQ